MTGRPFALVLEEAGVQRDRVHAGILDQAQALGEPRLAVGCRVSEADLHAERTRPAPAQVAQHGSEPGRIVEERAACTERPDVRRVAGEVHVDAVGRDVREAVDDAGDRIARAQHQLIEEGALDGPPLRVRRGPEMLREERSAGQHLRELEPASAELGDEAAKGAVRDLGERRADEAGRQREGADAEHGRHQSSSPPRVRPWMAVAPPCLTTVIGCAPSARSIAFARSRECVTTHT